MRAVARRVASVVGAVRPDLHGREFARWPAGRDVRFRDVVTYVIFDELVRLNGRAGTLADIEAVVASVVPAAL